MNFDVVKAYKEELHAVWLTRNKANARITQFIPSEKDHEHALQALEMRIRSSVLPEVRRILDEREVINIARETILPKWMYDTEGGRMALACFAHGVDKCWRQAESQPQPHSAKEE